jgi:hypothetical protein
MNHNPAFPALPAAPTRCAHGRITQLVLVLLWFGCASLAGAQPDVTAISPRGLSIGQTTTITVEGRHLASNPHLFAPIRFSRVVVQEATAERVVFAVSLEDDVPANLVPLRIVTDEGVSRAIIVGVDALPQVEYQPSIERLPVALHGRLGERQILKTTCTLAEGDSLVVDVEAGRIGSEVRPVVNIFSPDGRQLASARPSRILAGDARLQFKAPVAGVYSIELHDALYQGHSRNFFRLKIGNLRYADLAFPIGIRPEVPATLTLLSTNIASPGRSFARLHDGSCWVSVAWPPVDAGCVSGRQPLVRAGDASVPELLEQETRSASAPLPIPVAINGQLIEEGKADTFEFAVVPGKKLRCHVLSSRLGTLLDSTITVKDAKGNQLATNDDEGRSLDPRVDLVVPDQCDRIAISIGSTVRHYGSECIYRLSVEEAPETDFSLSASADRVSIPSGGRSVLKVDVQQRTGSPKPIQVDLEPSSGSLIYARPTTIEPDSNACLLEIMAEPHTQATTTFQVLGSVVDPHSRFLVRRAVVPPIEGLPEYSPWQHEVVARISNRPTLLVEWTDDQPARLVQGTHQAASLLVDLGPHFSSEQKLRATLLTSQNVPLKREGSQQVKDADRLLRLQNQQVVDISESPAKLPINIVVPNDLSPGKCDLAILIELLDQNGSTVLASAYSPVLRLAVEPAIRLALRSDAKPNVKLSESKSVVFEGTVTQAAGLNLPVRVFLTGLPKEYGVPEVVVPAGQSDFRLVANLEKADGSIKLEKLKLESQFAKDAGAAYAEVRGAPVDVEINISQN